MIKISEIAFIGYPVTNLERSRNFYEKILGLPEPRLCAPEKNWLEYDIGPVTFAISNIAPDWKASADGPNVAFEVEEFDDAVAHLRNAKVKFYTEPFDTGVCRMAIVADPDGNSITIHERHKSGRD